MIWLFSIHSLRTSIVFKDSLLLYLCRLLELEEEYKDGDITEKVSHELLITTL